MIPTSLRRDDILLPGQATWYSLAIIPGQKGQVLDLSLPCVGFSLQVFTFMQTFSALNFTHKRTSNNRWHWLVGRQVRSRNLVIQNIDEKALEGLFNDWLLSPSSPPHWNQSGYPWMVRAPCQKDLNHKGYKDGLRLCTEVKVGRGVTRRRGGLRWSWWQQQRGRWRWRNLRGRYRVEEKLTARDDGMSIIDHFLVLACLVTGNFLLDPRRQRFRWGHT